MSSTTPSERTTTSAEAARPPKRERLIAAALEEIHREGYAGTSLAKIADAADVPIGNVYYYFKTKDDLLHAVLDEHIETVEEMLEAAEANDDPKQRILAFVEGLGATADDVAARGCPLGCLTQDLVRSGGDAAPASAFERQLLWLEREFGSAGAKDPRSLAVHVMARTQGAATMCHSLGDAQVLRTELDRLRGFLVDAL